MASGTICLEHVVAQFRRKSQTIVEANLCKRLLHCPVQKILNRRVCRYWPGASKREKRSGTELGLEGP